MNARQYYASISSDRLAWKASVPQRCMICNIAEKDATFGRLEIHEILTRAALPKSYHFRANILLLCHECHHAQLARSRDSMIFQLAVKSVMDTKHYDLREWLGRRNPNALDFISQADVNRAILSMSTSMPHIAQQYLLNSPAQSAVQLKE